MINAVNAKTGKPHVTSDDVRNLNAALVGKENYVSAMHRALSAEMIDSNTLRIYEGSGFFNGCFFRVEGYEDATIATGAVGYNRVDVVVLKYTNENDIEGITVVTFAGTKTTGTPTAPAVPDTSILDGASVAYMPLYRVTLGGINITSITPVFNKLSDLRNIKDSKVDKVDGKELSTNDYTNAEKEKLTEVAFDSGWIELTPASGFVLYSSTGDSTLRCRRVGKVVEVVGVLAPSSVITGSSNTVTMFTLPEGFRPNGRRVYVQQGSAYYTWTLNVESSGVCTFSRYSDGTGYLNTVAKTDSSAGSWLPVAQTFIV